jgi:hypothetical protein
MVAWQPLTVVIVYMFENHICRTEPELMRVFKNSCMLYVTDGARVRLEVSVAELVIISVERHNHGSSTVTMSLYMNIIIIMLYATIT